MAETRNKKSGTHVLQDQLQIEAIVNRLKRAQGQLGAVARMIEDGRSCEEVITQISAASKAINTAAFNLISASLEECILAGKSNQEEVTEKLQKLFLTLA
jgi:DNA-binding FrmR family transcriptional regulator